MHCTLAFVGGVEGVAQDSSEEIMFPKCSTQALVRGHVGGSDWAERPRGQAGHAIMANMAAQLNYVVKLSSQTDSDLTDPATTSCQTRPAA